VVAGKVLVVGGVQYQEGGTADSYDPTAGSWVSLSNLNVARYGQSATVLPDGRLLVAGGCDPFLGVYLWSLETFDPATASWARVGHLSSNRLRHTATLLPSGDVLFVGGLIGATSFSPTASAELFASASLQPAPPSVPGTPRADSVVPANNQVTLTWTAAGDDGGSPITGYRLSTYVGGVLQSSAFSPVSRPDGGSYTVVGLSNVTAYTFSVAAVNAVGVSPDVAFRGPTTPIPVPDAPTNVVAVAGDGRATVSWTAPSANGGPITSFSVNWSIGCCASSAGSPVTVTGLTNGTSYTFTVTAINSYGAGPASALSNAVTPTASTVPGAPTNVIATAGNGQATLSWTAPSANGSPITGYTANWSGGSQVCGGSPCMVTGLINGTSYAFTVTATNAVGTGPASVASNAVTPISVPGAPTGVSAAAGNSQATVIWSAPSANGSPITGYTVTWSAGTTACSSSPCIVSPLSNGTSYTFTVTATNGIGTGPPSPPSNAVVPVTLPGPPTSVSAVAGDRQATVTWTAPSSDGGSPITGYIVIQYNGVTPQGPVVVGLVTSFTATGLVNSLSYAFSVTALTAVGASEAVLSNAVTPAAVPGAPSSVVATAGDSQATLSWTGPNGNGRPIAGYTVSWSGSSQACSGTPCIVTGLTNGTSYTFTVTATNSLGTGPPSGPSNSVTPIGPPAAPTAVTATAGNAQARVGWSAPSANGSGITGYTVNWSGGSQPCSGSPCLITGLSNGTSYTFTVTAANAVGTGPASVASNTVTPATVPGVPTGVSAAGGNSQATVGWTVPSANGSAITGYTASWSGGSQPCGGSPCVVTGLTNGTSYTFTVTATNAVGTGPASAASNAVIPVAVPGAPTNLTATAGNNQATVNWTAPSANGSPITGYTVSWSGGSQACSGSPCVVTGLNNGTSYAFTVTATNAVGTGPASPASNVVTPATVPGAPTAVSAAAGDSQATVNWTAPMSDGGAAIIAYRVTPYIGQVAQSPIGVGLVTSSTLTGLTNGTTYTFTVTALNGVGAGPESAASNFVTVASAGSPCSSAFLMPTIASPQPVGTSFSFTGSSTGCSHPEFKFFLDSPGGSWTAQTVFGGSTWAWNTAGRTPGVYGVGVWVRQTGSGASYEAYWIGTYTVSGVTCTAATVSTATTSPQAPGAVITFDAAATGCPSAQFRFWMIPHGGVWTMQRDYGAASWTWNTTGLVPGTYELGVWARQPGSTNAYDAYGFTTFAVGAGSCTSAGLSSDLATPQAPGATVVFTASTNSCPGALYEFWLLRPGYGWQVRQLYSAAATWNWDTNTWPPGTYQVGVWAKASASSAAYDAFFIATYQLNVTSGCTSASISAGQASPQTPGATVTFTATSTDCAAPSYEFWILRPNTAWSVAKPYGADATFSWNTTGLAPGIYEIGVWVRQNGSANSYDSYAIITFWVGT